MPTSERQQQQPSQGSRSKSFISSTPEFIPTLDSNSERTHSNIERPDTQSLKRFLRSTTEHWTQHRACLSTTPAPRYL